MRSYQLYRILSTLNIEICESEGAEDTTVLIRTFTTLDKRGGLCTRVHPAYCLGDPPPWSRVTQE